MCSLWGRWTLVACLLLGAAVAANVVTQGGTTPSPARNQSTLLSTKRALEIATEKCVAYGKHVYVAADVGVATLSLEGEGEGRVPRCHMERKTLIAGGELAGHGEFPHMVALGYNLPGDEDSVVAWRCGGSLISELFVLTAAHCLYDKRTGPVRWALLGSTELSDQRAQRIAVAEAIRHPAYKSSSNYRDIALLRLASAPALSPELRPACVGITQAQTVRPGKLGAGVDVTGWGLNVTGGDGAEHLRKVDMYLVAAEKCYEAYRFISGTRRLKKGFQRDSMLCFGNKEEGKDICQGDSGGPAQMKLNGTDKYCMYDVVGVDSFGEIDCGTGSKLPTVFTNVRYYLPWIVKVVWPEKAN